MRIGIVGSGQLGWMTLLEGRRYPFHFAILDDRPGPACSLAHRWYRFEEAKRFVEDVDVILYEFEHIPPEILELTAGKSPLPVECLLYKQDRFKEKSFLKAKGYPLPEFTYAETARALKEAVGRIRFPCLVKETTYGYDGKGQVVLQREEDLSRVTGSGPFLVEQFVPFEEELSLVGARNEQGEIALYPLTLNVHEQGILWYNYPVETSGSTIAKRAGEIVASLLNDLRVVGLLAVEFFRVGDELLINEFAPRPHNTGHYTLDAAYASQFENFLRVSLGYKPARTELKRPGGMANLIGISLTPRLLEEILSLPYARLYWYQKEVRPGRKVGHIGVFSHSPWTLPQTVRSVAERFPPMHARAESESQRQGKGARAQGV